MIKIKIRSTKVEEGRVFNIPGTIIFVKIRAPLETLKLLWFEEVAELVQFLFCDALEGAQGDQVMHVSHG